MCRVRPLEKPEKRASRALGILPHAARQKKARTAKKAEIKRQILKRISIFADGKFKDGGVKYNKWTAWLVQSGRVASRCSGAGRSGRADAVTGGVVFGAFSRYDERFHLAQPAGILHTDHDLESGAVYLQRGGHAVCRPVYRHGKPGCGFCVRADHERDDHYSVRHVGGGAGGHQRPAGCGRYKAGAGCSPHQRGAVCVDGCCYDRTGAFVCAADIAACADSGRRDAGGKAVPVYGVCGNRVHLWI